MRQPTKAELKGRINRFLDMRAYVAEGGSRACTMCGVNGKDCMVGLEQTKDTCCGACRDGNTHPAPGENQGSCREWIAGLRP